MLIVKYFQIVMIKVNLISPLGYPKGFIKCLYYPQASSRYVGIQPVKRKNRRVETAYPMDIEVSAHQTRVSCDAH